MFCGGGHVEICLLLPLWKTGLRSYSQGVGRGSESQNVARLMRNYVEYLGKRSMECVDESEEQVDMAN